MKIFLKCDYRHVVGNLSWSVNMHDYISDLSLENTGVTSHLALNILWNRIYFSKMQTMLQLFVYKVIWVNILFLFIYLSIYMILCIFQYDLDNWVLVFSRCCADYMTNLDVTLCLLAEKTSLHDTRMKEKLNCWYLMWHILLYYQTLIRISYICKFYCNVEWSQLNMSWKYIAKII